MQKSKDNTPPDGPDNPNGGGNGKALTWTAVANSTFSSNASGIIRAIAYGGGKFVACGNEGIAYSDDGITWTAVSKTNLESNNTRINGIAYGKGRFVAVGDEGKMAYSDDKGVTWTALSSSATTFASSNELRAITYGDGKFVATGESGKIAYSNSQE